MAFLIKWRTCVLHNSCYSYCIKRTLITVLKTELLNSCVTTYRQNILFPKISYHVEPRSLSAFCRSSESLIKQYNSRTLINSTRGNSYKFDPNQESRRQKLLLLTYLSGFIGACLLCAIGFRQYSALARRALGIEELHIREYGRHHHLYRYRGYVLPHFVIDDVKGIHTFDIREDDIWIVSYPKAGTTWLQEIVYLIVNDADFEKASEATIDERVPYFEFLIPGKKTLSSMPSPRLIKSHLPLSLLPNQISLKKPKIIYIARNPKDTVVSFYHYLTKFLNPVDHSFSGTFETFCQLFVEDLVHYGPWWKHVKEAWERREEDNILVLFYEDLKMDLRKGIQDIAQFLGKPISEEMLDDIVKHCSFESMKSNKSVNYDWFKTNKLARDSESFMRKGEVGDWRNHLSPDIVQKLDEVVAIKLVPVGVPVRDSLPKTSETA